MNTKKKNLKNDDLDTETTFVNMNVEGFKWYRPENKEQLPYLEKSEYRAMLKGACLAFIPLLIGIILIFLIIFGIAYLWLS